MLSDRKKGGRYALLALLIALVALLVWWGGEPTARPGSGKGPAARHESPVASSAPAAVPPASSESTAPKPLKTASTPGSPEAYAVLSGRVLDPESHQPVSGVRILWHPSPRYVSMKATASDAKGRYRLQIPARECGSPYFLTARTTRSYFCEKEGERVWPYANFIRNDCDALIQILPGLEGEPAKAREAFLKAQEEHQFPPAVPETARQAWTFPGLAKGEERSLDIFFDPGYTVVVDVLSTDGKPVEGVLRLSTWVATMDGGLPLLDGYLEIRGIDPKELATTEIQIQPEDHLPPPKRRLSDYPLVGRRIEVRETVSPGGFVEGMVTRPDGSVACGARVNCWPVGMSLKDALEKNVVRSGDTHEDGTFRVGGIPLEERRVQLWVFDIVPREVAVGERVLITQEEGKMISGRVLDAQGRPVPKARVTCDSERWDGSVSPCTDEQGRFELSVPAIRKHDVRAWPPYVPDAPEKPTPAAGWTDVPAGTENLEIVLTPEGGMRGYSSP